MLIPYSRCFAQRCEPLRSMLADCFQHCETSFPIGADHVLHEALLH